MDKLVVNGRINTLDPRDSVVEAALIRGGRIAALGTEPEMRKQASGRAEIIDLGGGTAFPGFYDCHNHMLIYSYLLAAVDLTPTRVATIDRLVELIKEAAQAARPGEWIRGAGFIDYALAEHRYPTRDDLDRVSPHNPVVLYHTSFHACVLNSKGLEAFGITPETEPLDGGEIEKDGAGRPTGVLHDANMMVVLNTLMEADLQAMSREEKIEMLAAGTDRFARLGLTGAADALVTPIGLAAYQAARAADRLNVRIYTMHEVNYAEGLIESGLATGFGDDWLRIGPIKVFADGGMSNRTAAMTEPYLTPPHGTGLVVTSRERLTEIMARVDPAGFQVAVHAQGDRAIADTLDAFESVLGKNSDNPLRHRIEHGGCMFPELLKRAAAMQVPVAVQPAMFSVLGDGWIEAYGPEKANMLYPYRTMLAAGIPLGGSSDCPVIGQDPRCGLRDAVLRRSPSGQSFNQDQALTVGQMIRLYTQGSAYLVHNETQAGTLAPGFLADLTVLAQDPREIPLEEVESLPITMTIVGGEIKHQS